MEEILERQLLFGGLVGGHFQLVFTWAAEPAILIVVQGLACRFWRAEKVSPRLEDSPEHDVDVRVLEERIATWGSQGPIQSCVYWQADHTLLPAGFTPKRGTGEEMAQDLYHVLVVTNLLVLFGRICVVRWFVGNLLEHRLREHVDPGVGINELAELLHGWAEDLWILVDLFEDAVEPLLVHVGITR